MSISGCLWLAAGSDTADAGALLFIVACGTLLISLVSLVSLVLLVSRRSLVDLSSSPIVLSWLLLVYVSHGAWFRLSGPLARLISYHAIVMPHLAS